MLPVPVFRIHLIICVMVISSTWFQKVSAQQTFVPEEHENWNNLDHKYCGYSHSKRIIGGKDAKLGEYPWLVLIGQVDLEGVMFTCGGAILNSYYVITADHCVYCEDCQHQTNIANIVRAGEYDLSSMYDCLQYDCAPTPQDRLIKVIHRIANQEIRPQNDIALLQVSKPFVINGFVLPVCLPNKDLIGLSLSGVIGTVAGWGATDNYVKSISIVLQKLRVQIMEQSTCNKFYRDFNETTQICARGNRMTAACNGDSGGPLFVRAHIRGQNQYFVIGVVSYGPKVCTNGPTVYTQITTNLKWILDHITMK